MSSPSEEAIVIKENYIDTQFQNKTKEELVKQISELRKSIKRKHRTLKRELQDTAEMWEKQLQPIAEPLKRLVQESDNIQREDQEKKLKDEEEIINQKEKRKRKLLNASSDDDGDIPEKRYAPLPKQGSKRKKKLNLPTKPDFSSDYEYSEGEDATPHPKRLNLPTEIEEAEMSDNAAKNIEEEEKMDVTQQSRVSLTPLLHPLRETYHNSPDFSSGQDLLKTPEGKLLAKNYVKVKFTGRTAKEYFLKLITGKKDIDTNYGIRVDGDEWKIGDKSVEIEENDLLINDRLYKGTRGLYELIFMNQPNEYVYSEEDLDNYGLILMDTNVYRTDYLPNGKIKSNKGHKYKYIIKPVISRMQQQRAEARSTMMETYADDVLAGANVADSSGGGLILPTKTADPNTSVIYFDDPNEIVDRLRLLIASEQAGNTGHKNEINAILEELFEMKDDLLNDNDNK